MFLGEEHADWFGGRVRGVVLGRGLALERGGDLQGCRDVVWRRGGALGRVVVLRRGVSLGRVVVLRRSVVLGKDGALGKGVALGRGKGLEKECGLGKGRGNFEFLVENISTGAIKLFI